MLKIKQSQVSISSLHGIGAVAAGVLTTQVTGIIPLGYLAAGIVLAICIWDVIKIQDDNHQNNVGYLNLTMLFLNLVFIALAFHWIASILLFIALVIVGFRYMPKN